LGPDDGSSTFICRCIKNEFESLLLNSLKLYKLKIMFRCNEVKIHFR
jgi:hypothetical protein